MKLHRSHAIVALMLIAPALSAALYVLLPGRTLRDCEMKTLERWRSGGTKTLACEWVEDGAEYARYCGLKPSGETAGCWITRHDEAYEGDVVEWSAYQRMPDPQASYGVPRAVMHYSQGRPDGLWLNYYPDGKLMNETVFKDGKGIEVRLYDQSGKLVRENRFSDF